VAIVRAMKSTESKHRNHGARFAARNPVFTHHFCADHEYQTPWHAQPVGELTMLDGKVMRSCGDRASRREFVECQASYDMLTRPGLQSS